MPAHRQGPSVVSRTIGDYLVVAHNQWSRDNQRSTFRVFTQFAARSRHCCSLKRDRQRMRNRLTSTLNVWRARCVCLRRVHFSQVGCRISKLVGPGCRLTINKQPHLSVSCTKLQTFLSSLSYGRFCLHGLLPAGKFTKTTSRSTGRASRRTQCQTERRGEGGQGRGAKRGEGSERARQGNPRANEDRSCDRPCPTRPWLAHERSLCSWSIL